jgi:hypothetical protein
LKELDSRSLSGRDERPLALDPVEVGVGVPVPDEGQRLASRQLLVARLQVDREGRPAARVVVEVASVDVHPDPAELVDGLMKPR